MDLYFICNLLINILIIYGNKIAYILLYDHNFFPALKTYVHLCLAIAQLILNTEEGNIQFQSLF